MMNSIAPGMILILGALLIPFLRGTMAKAVALALPIISAVQMAMFPKDMVIQAEIFDFLRKWLWRNLGRFWASGRRRHPGRTRADRGRRKS